MQKRVSIFPGVQCVKYFLDIKKKEKWESNGDWRAVNLTWQPFPIISLRDA